MAKKPSSAKSTENKSEKPSEAPESRPKTVVDAEASNKTSDKATVAVKKTVRKTPVRRQTASKTSVANAKKPATDDKTTVVTVKSETKPSAGKSTAESASKAAETQKKPATESMQRVEKSKSSDSASATKPKIAEKKPAPVDSKPSVKPVAAAAETTKAVADISASQVFIGAEKASADQSAAAPSRGEVKPTDGVAPIAMPASVTNLKAAAKTIDQSAQPAPVGKSSQSDIAKSETSGAVRRYQEPDDFLASRPQPVEEARSIKPPVPAESEQVRPLPEAEVNPEPEYQEPMPGPNYPSMYIVQIAPELAPLAKVGGLADVVMGISRELELRGHSVEVILPKYDSMRYDHVWGLCKTYEDLWVPWYNGHIHCTVWFGFVHGRKCFFIEPHSPDNFFNRGSIYGFDDDILRFAFFSRAAMEFLYKANKHPDIIHCHDWQTALVPVFLYEIYQHLGMWHPRVCYTIHNFKHQGKTGDFLLQATGLNRPEYYFHYDRLQDNHTPHALNLMKGGVVYSNFVTTVSPRHAGEAKDGGQGFGLEPTLHTHHYKYGGVVNGIDYDAWNPEIDPYIPVPYNIENIEQKYDNKRALRHRLMLADNEKPIVAFVGRLDPQKGLDLVRHALFYCLNNGAQFVLLGSSPEGSINRYFWELKRHLNDSPDCHIEVSFDEELAHLIYAGADMMVVPSLFEPCGLTQLIAMQYGTIPIVREVGGLADTVFDKDYAHHKPLNERNGYVFKTFDNAGLESALSRALACYYQYPEHFRELIKNAIRFDYSWKWPGQHYLNIYQYIRNP